MKNINNILNILKISFLFDDAFKNKQYDDVKKYYHQMKEEVMKLENDTNIVNLFKNLDLINEHIVNMGIPKINEKFDKSKNTIIFFYSPNCAPSKKFSIEWEKIKNKLELYMNVISIDCTNPKYTEICNYFNVSNYPTVKYVRENEIVNYYDEMTADSIFNDITTVLK